MLETWHSRPRWQQPRGRQRTTPTSPTTKVRVRKELAGRCFHLAAVDLPQSGTLQSRALLRLCLPGYLGSIVMDANALAFDGLCADVIVASAAVLDKVREDGAAVRRMFRALANFTRGSCMPDEHLSFLACRCCSRKPSSTQQDQETPTMEP